MDWEGAVRIVPDEVYERFVDLLSQEKKAKNFKAKIFGEAGDCIGVYCRPLPGSNDVDFFCKNRGVEQLIVSRSSTHTCGPDQAEIRRRQLENHTGKHRSKVHGVKVPTAAGQPVRG